ncbi:MAG: hypothetical protein II793_04290 [Bacteroidales bacterium]|nr:hypothetical protein [Bacteroidales bacterium]
MTTYRPRNTGHDYYGRSIYLITLVVSQRRLLLSQKHYLAFVDSPIPM